MDHNKYGTSKFKGEIKEAVMACESIRKGNTTQDITLSEYFKEKNQVEMSAVYEDLGIDPQIDTIQNLFTLPDESVRYLVPEIIRDAIRLGLRKSPIYPNITAAEQTVSQLSITMPHINMAEAAPRYVGEGETIQTGTVSYGSKTVKIRKMGRGIKITDEVKQYCSLDVVGIFLQDFGVKLGRGMDALAIDCLLNGDQAGGAESAPVVGVATISSLVYKDLLKVWVRMSRLGKNSNTMIAGETLAVDILDMPEFKNRTAGTTQAKLNVKTPIPTTADMYIHGSVPANQVIALDPSSTIIKLNATPLLVETERIVSNQTQVTYATITTGFCNVFRDSRIVIDKSLAFASNGFPTYMDADAEDFEVIK